jgi:hypothetical protein
VLCSSVEDERLNSSHSVNSIWTTSWVRAIFNLFQVLALGL